MSRRLTSPIGTLLGVWAHPDDEAYLSAGLMARTVDSGGRVVVVTATAGEHGTSDPDAWPPIRLAALRRHEMRASLAALGVREHHWLGHPDGACDNVDDESAVRAIGALIDEVRPDTIVTFGPDGMTGHADHQAVSRWTTKAWLRHPDVRLWYATLLPTFHEEWVDVNDAVGLFPDPAAAPITPLDQTALVIHCDDEPSSRRRKAAALRAHTSQTQPLIDLLGAPTFERWWNTEAFVDAARLLAKPKHLCGATT